jgi:hypothetical protein
MQSAGERVEDVSGVGKRPRRGEQLLRVAERESCSAVAPARRRRRCRSSGTVAGTLCMEDQPTVDRYNLAFEHLRATALSTRDSLAWIEGMAERMG